MARILVACEFSGLVRDAFLARGHDALSCDLEPTERPGPHYQGDVRDILSGAWDMLIAFPPCTYLACVGMCRKHEPGRQEKTLEALSFVRMLLNAPIPRIALENPVGIISTAIRKPDQYIQPYWYGHDYSKKTCLWLKNLPPLMAGCVTTFPQINSFVMRMPGGKNRAKNRSRTFSGIAFAMAEQWGGYC